MLRLLLRQRFVELGLVDVTALHQQLAEPLPPRRPGIDDPALVEADPPLRLATGKGERAGAAAEMDELEGVRDGDVLDVAGEAHRPYCLRTSATRPSSVFSLRSAFE